MRDKKVIIVSSPHGRDVDKHYQEICGLASAARNHWATYRGAFVVLPNFAYGRQERESFAEREAVFGPQMARRFEEEGVHSAMAMDMHSDAVAGAFKGPWERLYGAYFMSMYYQHMFPGVVPVIVGPDSGGLKRAKHYQGFLRSPLLVNADKFRVETGKGAGAVEMGELNGQVVDQDCVIPDDILSSGTTLEEVAKLLKGAKSVTAIATHGEFIKSGRARMMRCEHIDHVIVSDTLPQQEDILRVMGMDQKIHVAHMSGVFAKAIQIVLSGKSHTMKELYQMPFDHLHMV
jgi:ribose-phosphate pyrophosphokinase